MHIELRNHQSRLMRLLILTLFIITLLTSRVGHTQSAIYSAESIHHPLIADNGMVSTQHPIATQIGLDILKQGGNAVDAAVAVGFALAVVLPRAGNLGGGGFMIVHMADTKKTKAINYREMAPLESDRDMYLNDKGEVDNDKFNQSYHSIGVPGTVAGLLHALENYGTMDVKSVIQPAIHLATDGFMVTHDLERVLTVQEDRLSRCEATKAIFFPNDSTLTAGDPLIQSDLAWSLTQIAEKGWDGFYRGELAMRITRDIRQHGGIITVADLNNYKVTETDCVWGDYREHKIASMPPPSSGGVHLIQMLNILEGFPIDSLQHNSSETIHLMVEAMRYAYADRSEHMGDPAFWDVPVDGLTSKAYAGNQRQRISADTITSSTSVNPGQPADYESNETTHYSVADQYGNVVSNTYTLNFSFGSGLVATGTGILLNNEMGDFSAKPGSANAYGLIGGEANTVQPGKRPLSSMTPTIVFKDDKPYIVTGSPGGSRIITTVLQIIMNVIDHDMNIAEATHAPRIHHQWYPDKLFYEKYFSSDTRAALGQKGHVLQQRAAMGSTQSILINGDQFHGSSDPRRPDGTVMGY